MISVLSPGASAPGSSPGHCADIVLCSWARHFTLTVPLSTQVYKWVMANLMLGDNSTIDYVHVASHPGESRNIPSHFNWAKLWPDGPLGSYADLTVLYNIHVHAAYRMKAIQY